MSPANIPPLDEMTVDLLTHIEWLRTQPCPCHATDGTYRGNTVVQTFLTFDRYQDLLECREINAVGHVRCSGWAPSQGRRCAQMGDAPGTSQMAYPRFTACCEHRGVWVDLTTVGKYVCETHR